MGVEGSQSLFSLSVPLLSLWSLWGPTSLPVETDLSLNGVPFPSRRCYRALFILVFIFNSLHKNQ